MTEKEKFNKSVSVLVKAYLNDTLVHGNCYACAVGNLVADAMGIKIVDKKEAYGSSKRWDSDMQADWFDFIMDYYNSYSFTTRPNPVRQAEAIGYTPEQVVRIEHAFEGRYEFDEKQDYKNEDERRYRGLMRVVDVLAGIHHVELSDVNEAKAMFVKT